MARFNGTARALALILAALSACARSVHAETAEAPPATTDASRTASSGEASAWDDVQIVIYKSKRVLALYRSGNFAKEYPVVLGLEPAGRKRHAHDARTPEGLYHVVSNRRHARWQFFLALDYPNDGDRSAYDDALRRGRIPDDGGKPVGIGDAIGIHGNDREADQDAGVNWTKGCVAMKAADIAEIAATVRAGAPVWIVE